MRAAAIPENEAERAADLHSYALLDTLDERGYDDVTMLASYICETPVSLVTLVDTERQWFKSARGIAVRETTREDSFCSHLIGGPSVLVVQDTLLDERFVDNPLVTGESGIRFYAGAPLITPDGNVIGSVCVVDQKPRTLRADQVRALEALARGVMARMELRRQMRERDHTEAALRTAEKLAAVGRMASSIAHEINNPLQSVTNLLFVVGGADDAAERAAYLRMAQDELSRVTSIVTQALRFHRQSSAPAAVRLGELAESVLMLFRTRLTHGGVLVEVRDRQVEQLLCFADDMRQLISHLLSNALDALTAKRCGGALTMHICDGHDARTGGAVAVLAIADGGVGISPVAMERLFQPFNTTKGARGTGLGLWVTKSIVEKHGGSVRVRSRPGVGTVVRIVLPLRPVVG